MRRTSSPQLYLIISKHVRNIIVLVPIWSSFEILTLENTIKTPWTKYKKKIAQKI